VLVCSTCVFLLARGNDQPFDILSSQQILDFGRNTLDQFSASDSQSLLYVLSRQLAEVRTRADDVANWPNPFQGQSSKTYQDTDATWLSLIDGSSNSENVPYGPLLVNARNLDVIVTLEGSADDPINGWPKCAMIPFSVIVED
jgi:lysophospholipase